MKDRGRSAGARRSEAHRAGLFLRALALWSLVALSCRSKADVADAAPPPSFYAKTAVDSGRSRDELWRRALDGDPLDLAHLADREGSTGLLEGLEEGGPIALTALAALPFADDADAAYQRLGEIVRQIDPGESSHIVRAIADIALRPRSQTEAVDPAGLRSCAEALLALAERKNLSKTVRAPVISALRLLAERGALRESAIPTDLDAK